MTRRTGLFKSLEKAITRSFFEDTEDAKQYALEKKKSEETIEGIMEEFSNQQAVS
jgi:hypothetical protein